MILSHEPPRAQNLNSDSDSDSSDDDLDNIIRKNLHAQVSNNPNQLMLSTKFKVCTAIVLVMIAVILLFQTVSISAQSQKADNIAKIQQKINQRQNNPTALPPPQSEVQLNDLKENRATIKAEEEGKMKDLRQLNKTEQIKNVYFLSQDQFLGTTHWFMKQDVRCIPDYTVNSASKISDTLYIQKTAYEDINLASYAANIPAINIYSLESPRQFIQNMSVTYPNQILAYDHQDPLLLTLIIRYFPKGIFVSKGIDWHLLEQNLLLNDLLSLANFVDRSALLQSDLYHVLITSNMKEAIQLISNDKRGLIVLTNLYEPTLIQTALLRKMNIYKLSDGQECQHRTIGLIQEPTWRVEEFAFLLMGWYALTSLSYSITFSNHIFDYQTPLIKQTVISCEISQLYQATKQLLPNNKIQILQLPFDELYLYSKENMLPQQNYRQIFAYLKNISLAGPVYLDSGSYHFLLVVVYSLPNKLPLFLNGSYPQKKQLLKNLVLNSLQKVQLIHNEIPKVKYELAITTIPQNLNKIPSQKYLLLLENTQTINEQFKYTQLVSKQCHTPDMRVVSEPQLAKGLYLVERK